MCGGAHARLCSSSLAACNGAIISSNLHFNLSRMTGVGGRPEIVIEGSDSLDGPWKVLYLCVYPRSPSEVIQKGQFSPGLCLLKGIRNTK